MAKRMLDKNKEHFGQPRHCTLTLPPLDLTMEFTTTCERANAILEGQYLLPAQPPPMSHRLQQAHDESNTSTSNDSTNEVHIKTLSDNETDTQDTPSNPPMHLQRDKIPDLIQLLIDSSQYTTTPDAIPPEITEEEYKGKQKIWDKRTSTSSTSNMHLGHLKAYWAEHTLAENSNEANLLETTQQQILEGHITLLNYAMHFGYSFDKWKCIVNTMLEKD